MTELDAMAEVAAERHRQGARRSGGAPGDAEPLEMLMRRIHDHSAWSRVALRAGAPVEARELLVQLAAMSVMAVETLDRGRAATLPRYPSGGRGWE